MSKPKALLRSMTAVIGMLAVAAVLSTPSAWAQGQKVLIWMSCTTWSDAQAGAYSLKIEKL